MLGVGVAISSNIRRGLSLDFTKGMPSGVTFSRTGAGMAQSLDGSWSSFATGVPRRTDRGILIEEARTNLNPTSTLNPLPAGSVNIASAAGSASPITGNTSRTIARIAAGTNSYIQQTITSQASGTVLTLSVIAKAGIGGRLGLRISSAYPDRADAVFDLSNGTVVGTLAGGTGYTGLSASIIPQSGGFYRCILTATVGATAATSILVGPTDSTRALGSWEGPTTPLCSADVDAFQCEVGAFATSPITTTGATATRGADQASVTSLSSILAFPFTFVSKGGLGANAYPAMATLNDGTASNAVFHYRASVGGILYGQIASGGGATNISMGALNVGAVFTVASRVDATGIRSSKDGAAVVAGTRTVGSLNTLWIGFSASGPTYANDYVQRVSITPGGLTDAQIQAAAA